MNTRRRRTLALGATLATVWLVAVAGPVAGHAELVSSQPADGSRLEQPPDEIVIIFDSELAPDSSFAVLNAAGGTVGSGELDLDVAERNVLRGALNITDDGTYTVQWTAVAADGHPSEGAFSFEIGSGQAPDTAVPTRSPSPVLGALLLLMFTLLAGAVVRQSRRR